MLPGMMAKPRIAIVGPGNLGSALAVALHVAGFGIEAIVGRSGGNARTLARRVDARARDVSNADIIWFCVPDAEIDRAAKRLASKFEWKGKIALHSSGALTSDELAVLRRKGAAVGSVHPLMTFVEGTWPLLAGVHFAIEGDAAAVKVARRIVRELGGHPYAIRQQDKAAYHAWGTFASPLLTALLATTERAAGLAGVRGKAARRRMGPILLQTLTNYLSLGAAKGFSGPIIRGDVETVRKHLRVLGRDPVAGEVYRALAQAALAYLPTKNAGALKRVLSQN